MSLSSATIHVGKIGRRRISARRFLDYSYRVGAAASGELLYTRAVAIARSTCGFLDPMLDRLCYRLSLPYKHDYMAGYRDSLSLKHVEALDTIFHCV